ncbi:MAG: hypothetical protein ACT6S0_07455 [Roseateles sp.]|uniref:hypothetical protein n=1 Tax=Roseateles sp. TaxID=1971397 RepID=UPI004035ED15
MSAWRPFLASCLLSISTAFTAAAADDLELSGFGTLSAYRGDDPTVAVRPRRFVVESSSDGQWRWDGDSVLGVQARWQLSDSVQAIWQLQAADEIDRRYRPRTEWLFLGWTLSPAWSLRVGRQPLPLQQHSEARNVGLARVTVRPVATVYELISNTPVDGATLSWNADVGGGSLMVDLAWGRFDIRSNSGRAVGRSLGSIAARWQYGPATLRAGLSRGSLDLLNSSLEALGASLRQPGGPCLNCDAVFGARLKTQDIGVDRITFGQTWAWGPWALDMEFLRRNSNSVVTAAADGWYALLSRRHGRLTPFVAIGATRYREAPLGLQVAAGTPPGVAASITALDQRLQSRQDRQIALAGLRWDLHERAAFKLQYERWRSTRDTQTPRNDEILLAEDSGGWDGRASLLSLSLDFVF